MSHYSGLDAINSPVDKPDIWSAEIISLWSSTAEIKSAEINSVNSMSKSQKFIPAEITRYTVYRKILSGPWLLTAMFDLDNISHNHIMTLTPGHFAKVKVTVYTW